MDGGSGTGTRKPALPVERVARLTRTEFEREHLRPGRPVIFTGVLRDWPALGRWTPEYLGQKVGAKRVVVFHSPEQTFKPDPARAYDGKREEVGFAEYLDDLLAGGKNGHYRYLATVPILESFPELVEDIGFTSLLRPTPEYMPCLWVGAAGTVTPLHYDPFPAHNFFAQVRGRKRLVLFHPDDSVRLYPNPAPSRVPQFSQLDPEAPDLERFPLFARAQPYVCEVGPGEMLFLPVSWWHQVTSLEMAISVNVWWRAPMLRRRWPPRSHRPRRGPEAQ